MPIVKEIAMGKALVPLGKFMMSRLVLAVEAAGAVAEAALSSNTAYRSVILMSEWPLSFFRTDRGTPFMTMNSVLDLRQLGTGAIPACV